MDEPLVEIMAEKTRSNLPFVIGAAAAVVLVVIAWFWVLLPKEADEEARVATNSNGRVATSTLPGVVSQPIVVITESGGVISAREVRPIRLDSGQYIYIVPFETPNQLVDQRGVARDDNKVFGYSYVPEY